MRTAIEISLYPLDADYIPPIKAFIDRLHSTNVFPEVLAIEEHTDESGLWQTSLEAIYAPSTAKPAARGAARR